MNSAYHPGSLFVDLHLFIIVVVVALENQLGSTHLLWLEFHFLNTQL